MKKITLYMGILLGITYMGCKKFDNPPPIFEDPEDKIQTQRKVLVISIDGVTGSELKTIAPPVIEELKNTSKYTYDVLRGTEANDPASWASMLTGATYTKHLIKTEDFLPTPKENSHDAPPVYRNMFDYVLQYKSVKTAVVSPWDKLRYYLRVADINPVVNTDVAVKDSTINILNTQTAIGTLVVNFREVLAAGANGGFVASNANYKNAILKADEYVGDIVKALKARKTYANEDWLIIITSNHGGSSDNPQAGFLIASQGKLKSEELKQGFNTIYFGNPTVNATSLNAVYESGSNKDFTIQMQFKYFARTGSYPSFLSKGTGIDGSKQTGWLWMTTAGGAWQASFNATNNGRTGGRIQAPATTNIIDGSWHTLTMKVQMEGTVRKAYVYTDGKLEGSGVITNVDLTNPNPLKLGFLIVDTSTDIKFYAADLVYFNVALSDQVIKENIALKNMSQHPNYNSIIGYWPINDRVGGILKNNAPVGFDMTLNGPYTWADMGNNLPVSVAPIEGKAITVTSASVAALSLYWMNINILPEFGMDGNPILNQFELEFLK